MRKHIGIALLAIAFSLGLSIPPVEAGDGFGFGPAQGSGGGGGGGAGTVTVTGDGISGDGSAGTPLALAADLENLVDTAAIDASGNVTLAAGAVLDASVTGALRLGSTTSGARLEINSGVLTVREGDDSANAPMEALSLLATSHATLLSADTSGIRLEVNAGSFDVREGDDSALAPMSASVLTAGTRLVGPAGSASAASVGLDATDGLFFVNNTSLSATVNGTEELRLTATGLDVGPNLLLAGASLGSADVSLARPVAGVLQVSDAAGTGAGQFRSRGATVAHANFTTTAADTALYAYRDDVVTANLQSYSATASTAPRLDIMRGRGTAASPALVNDEDILGTILFRAADSGTAIADAAMIRAIVSGTPGASGDMPTRLGLWVCPDGGGGLTEELRITPTAVDLGAGRLVFGAGIASTTDVGLVRDAPGRLRVSDASTGDGILYAEDLIVGSTDGNGYMLQSTDNDTLTWLDGDGTDLSPADEMAWGSTTGNPLIRMNVGATNGGYVFVGDNNTGMNRSGADTLTLFTGGTVGLEITSGQLVRTASSLIITTNDANGIRLGVNSGYLEVLDGDGTALAAGEGLLIGNARVLMDTDSLTNVSHSFASDQNTGLTRVEADAPGLVAEGQFRTIWSNNLTLTEGTATNLVTIPLAAGEDCAGSMEVYVRLTDGTDVIRIVRNVSFVALDEGGTLTSNLDTHTDSGAGTATTGGHAIDDGPTFSIVDGTNAISIALDVGAAGTNTVTCRWVLHMSHSGTNPAITIP